MSYTFYRSYVFAIMLQLKTILLVLSIKPTIRRPSFSSSLYRGEMYKRNSISDISKPYRTPIGIAQSSIVLLLKQRRNIYTTRQLYSYYTSYSRNPALASTYRRCIQFTLLNTLIRSSQSSKAIALLLQAIKTTFVIICITSFVKLSLQLPI